MATYKLTTSVPGYYTSADAKSKRNSNSTVKSGTYNIFNQYNGMINLALSNGNAGWWINPGENKKTTPPKESGSSSRTDTSGNHLDNSKYTGMNSATVYKKNPKYAGYKRDSSALFYITNLLTGTTMEMDLSPTILTESNSANFSSDEVRGRSTPIYGYSSSGPRSMSFNLHLYDDYCYYGLLNTTRFLKGLEYPSYNSGVVAPPRAFIKYGKMISMRCIVESVQIEWTGPKRDGIHVEANVSISVKEVTQSPYSVGDIEKGGDYVS